MRTSEVLGGSEIDKLKSQESFGYEEFYQEEVFNDETNDMTMYGHKVESAFSYQDPNFPIFPKSLHSNDFSDHKITPPPISNNFAQNSSSKTNENNGPVPSGSKPPGSNFTTTNSP